MKNTFINLSNHASVHWSDRQLQKAAEYGEIVDLPFPMIDPHASSEEIDALVEAYCQKVLVYGKPVVMLQGEFIFTYRLVTLLKQKGICVVASCSERRTEESVDETGKVVKRSEFEFVGFKEY